MNDKLTCCVVGVGEGNGAAFVRKFANENYNVAMLARNESYLEKLEKEIPNTKGFVHDVTSLKAAKDTYTQIENSLGPIDTLVYNAGTRDFNNISDTNEKEFERAWHVNTYGCFFAIKCSMGQMIENNKGNIVIIGATASIRGAEDFVAFASSKAAQRSLAQSVAKHLGPKGIHVSYVIIDAVVDRPTVREVMLDKTDEHFIKPEHIADTVFFLTQQPKSCWTFELDLRPYIEKWQ